MVVRNADEERTKITGRSRLKSNGIEMDEREKHGGLLIE